MRRCIEAGLPAGALVSWDGLHNSVAGYVTVSVGRWRGPFTPAGAELCNDLCRCRWLPRPSPCHDEKHKP
jgi:hypothetical protein